MFELNTNQGYFLHLLSCALNNKIPCEKPVEVSFDQVFQLAVKHNVANILWTVIDQLDEKPYYELFSNWQQHYAMCVNSCVYQHLEQEILTNILVSKGYRVLFLKGSQIRDYYPEPDMRTMGDLDILVDTESRETIRKIMIESGYEIDILNDKQVDGFKKEPYLYVEIHYGFMHEKHRHYEDFVVNWNDLLPCNVDGSFKMKLDDLYYFNIGHYSKNMDASGIGVRAVMDSYVLWKCMSNEEKNNVNIKLEKCGLLQFSNQLLKVAMIWFDNSYDDESTMEIQKYIINGSVYGSPINLAKYRLMSSKSDDNRIKYFLKRVFPDAQTLYYRFNIKNQCVILIPFLWILRIILLPFSSKEKKYKLKKEINDIDDVNIEELNTMKQVYDDFGLSY